MLLDAGGRPDWALPVAVRKSNADLIRLLLSKGADPKPALVGAVTTCNSDVVQLLLDSGAKPDDSAILAAVRTCRVSLVHFLLERGANPNAQEEGRRLTLSVLSPGGFRAIETEDKRGWTALGIAVSKGDAQLVDLLLLSGANPNLQFIASTSDKSLEQTYFKALASGILYPFDAMRIAADAEAMGKALTVDLGNGNYITKNGKTITAVLNSDGVPNWMVTKSKESFVTTPLILATRQNRAAIVEILLKAGADVNLTDEKNRKALTYAQELGYIDIQLLLEK